MCKAKHLFQIFRLDKTFLHLSQFCWSFLYPKCLYLVFDPPSPTSILKDFDILHHKQRLWMFFVVAVFKSIFRVLALSDQLCRWIEINGAKFAEK